MLDVTIDVRRIDGAIAFFQKFPERLQKHLQKAMVYSQREVLKEAKDRVHVVTGTLRRSITAPVPTQNAEGGYDGVVGTNVRYAPVEEFGYQGTVSVKSYTRQVRSRSVMERRKKIAQGIAFVHAHTRRMNRQPHPYLRPALEAAAPEIKRLHVQAVHDAIASEAGS